MHIGFQRSTGRGEYEVAGSQSGQTAKSLTGWTFSLLAPDGIERDAGLELRPESSGKTRLRSTRIRKFQIGRMIAAMVLLPKPIRSFAALSNSSNRKSGFILTRIVFGPTTVFDGVTRTVRIDPLAVELDDTEHKEYVGIQSRWARISDVYQSLDRLPPEVMKSVAAHRDYLAQGAEVEGTLERIVSALQRSLERELDLGQYPYSDPLPALEKILGLSPAQGPDLPPPDDIEADEHEVIARSAHQYRQAKSRGTAGKKFSIAVHLAYDNRCAFCGGQYGGLPGIRTGVDAAHILAWSQYDLDVVQNGISLCKLHHWAFDACLLVPVYEGNDYVLRFTNLASGLESSTRRTLGLDGFVLPREWLPLDTGSWPNPVYLKKLYEDLAITFPSRTRYLMEK